MSSENSNELMALVGRLDPLDAAAADELVESHDRDDLFGRIVSAPLRRRRAGLRDSLLVSRARGIRALPRRRGLALLAGVAACLAVLAVLLASSAFAPSPVSAAVSFSQRGDYIIARIVNPFASAAVLRREFARYHLRITVRLFPASPGSVGKVSYLDVSKVSKTGQIESLLGHGDECLGGPACPVGLRIPKDYAGSATIGIDRPARAGERYASSPQAGSFAPHEPLHCSGLLGASVAKVLPVLREKGLSVVGWRAPGGPAGSSGGSRAVQGPPAADHVWMVSPVEQGKVKLLVNQRPLPATLAQAIEVQAHC